MKINKNIIMKKIQYAIAALLSVFTLGSCSLDDAELFDQKDGANAYSSLKDVANGMNGAYYYLGQYRFLGNYAVTLADFAAGISAGSASSGHFYAYSDFTFDDTDEELEDVWNYGYKVITTATKTINGANELIEDEVVFESQLPTVYNYMAQCYALKALANYYLVNLFALPYSDANKSKLGVVVIDNEVPEAFEKVERSTIEETYAQITKDIASAEEYFELADDEAEYSSYYMGPMGLQALKARVYMSLGLYEVAEAAALEALALKDCGDGTADDEVSDASYLTMWGSVAESDEDLFAIKKSDDDNLSANSINTLYNSYFCTIQSSVVRLFGENDIRASLLKNSDGGGTTTKKYDGVSALDVTNIHIFRKSEMSLILAEIYARQGNVEDAQNYLMYTAQRDKDVDAKSLPTSKEGLLEFISQERIREFYGEGHRFYDARRMGELVSGDQFSEWDIKEFCFPIPQYEINSGFGCTQNDGWEDNLPR